MPLYSSARSKHAFTQHQLLTLVVLRQMLSKSYRDFADLVELMMPLRRRLRLTKMPHYTTLHKFSMRLDAHMLDGLLFTLASSIADGRIDAIIDSTAMQSGSASYFYIRTLSLRDGSKGTVDRAVRRHIKLTLAVDSRTMTILAMLTTPGPGPDFELFRPTVLKAFEHGSNIATIIADKGYDSESNRRFVVHELGAEAHIPVRKAYRSDSEHQGFYRRRQLTVFSASLYRRRALVETVNSMLKRTMSSTTLARSERTRFTELALRSIAHNAKRAAELVGNGR